MAKVYKVWVCIEEYDTETEEGIDVDVGTGCTATVDDYESAHKIAVDMHKAFMR